MISIRKFAVLAAVAAGLALSNTTWSSAGLLTYIAYSPSKTDAAGLAALASARGGFIDSLSSYGVEDYEDLIGNTNPTLTFTGTALTATTTLAKVQNAKAFAVSGNGAALDTGPATKAGAATNDVFNFNQPITAFGSYITQGGDGDANTITFRLENTFTGTSKDVLFGTFSSGGLSNVRFFGVTDTQPFNRVTLIETLDYDGMLFDDTIAGFVASVPEPGTGALLAAGVACLWGARRRLRSTR